tara:strand:+ start:25 stop:192 length:168 start_codon:yes stop_codon:yes gene_type:complete
MGDKIYPIKVPTVEMSDRQIIAETVVFILYLKIFKPHKKLLKGLIVIARTVAINT